MSSASAVSESAILTEHNFACCDSAAVTESSAGHCEKRPSKSRIVDALLWCFPDYSDTMMIW